MIDLRSSRPGDVGNEKLTAFDQSTPIILGNAPSAGSSLLRVILSRHPDLYAGPELAIFDKQRLLLESPASFERNIGDWLENGYPNHFVGSGFRLFTHLEDYSWTFKDLFQLARESSDYGTMVKAFLDRERETCGAQRWVEKTPGNVFCFAHLRRLFPGAQFVHIIRDGRDCVASLVRRGHSPFRAVSRWFCATLAGISHREMPGYYELRYEDLARDPEPVVRDLCAFLDLPFHPAMLQAEGAGGRQIRGWKSNKNDRIATTSVGQYKKEFEAPVRSVFSALGLSSAGEELLALGEKRNLPRSALELQRHLGYDLDLICGAPGLDSKSRHRSRSEFRRWRWRVLRKYRRWYRSPTLLR